jgi:hypothetical protein
LRLDSNQYHQIQNLICCHCTTQQFAVRMRVELIASDRQSEMLAVTLTNQYSGVLAEAALHTTFQGLAVCTGFEPVSSSRKLDILNHLD